MLLGSELTPAFIPKLLGNTLIFLNPLLLYEGFNRFYGIRRRWWGWPLNLSLLLASVALLTYFLYGDENLVVRTIIINVLVWSIVRPPCIGTAFSRHSASSFHTMAAVAVTAAVSFSIATAGPVVFNS